MATATPNFTDNVSVIAAATLARGSTTRGTIDLRAKYGGYLFIRIGRGGTTALAAAGVDVVIRRLNNNDGNSGQHPAALPALRGSTTAAASTTCATSDSNSGQAALNVASVTGFAAGDIICIQDSGGGVTRLEFQRVSKTAAGVLTLDRNLNYTHTAAGADTVRNQADVFAPVPLDPGALWEVVIDYGAQSAGDTITVEVVAQRYDSDTIA